MSRGAFGLYPRANLFFSLPVGSFSGWDIFVLEGSKVIGEPAFEKVVPSYFILGGNKKPVLDGVMKGIKLLVVEIGLNAIQHNVHDEWICG